jgi:hypothetical protein
MEGRTEEGKMDTIRDAPAGPSGRGERQARRVLKPLAAALIVLAGTASLSPVTSEPLPDFQWRRSLGPVKGAFNRNEASPVRFTLRLEGRVEQIPIGWRLFNRRNEIAVGDTVVPASERGRDTVFTLRVPPLSPGSYLLEITTDPQGLIEESDETNNTVSYPFRIPNGAPVRFRCEGPEGSIWEVYRVELSTSEGDPYPDDFGTIADTTRATDYEVVVNGVEPGDYIGVFFGPTVNRVPVLISEGSFTMPDPPEEIEVVWQRTTPYIVGRPRVRGDAPVAVGGESGAPRWQPYDRYSLDGTVRNPTDSTAEIQWVLRFLDEGGYTSAEEDTLLYLGALGTSGVFVTGRILDLPGNYLLQAEVRVPWPTGFQDLGEDLRAASFVLPLGWIEVER